jgi:3-dehydroquinate dehydratase II
MRLLIINGPNLNLLGVREPHIYGAQTLADIETDLRSSFPEISFDFFQSNHEGAIIDLIQSTIGSDYDGIVMNPAAFTHYSYAIRDAVSAISIPVVEVHLSNIHMREEFRRHSVIAPVCKAQFSGFGSTGYRLAVTTLAQFHHQTYTS